MMRSGEKGRWSIMGKGSILLLFMVAAAMCLLMGNLPAATMNSATCGTWLPEVGVDIVKTTAAADQIQLQAVLVEKDIGAAARSNVLAGTRGGFAPNVVALQNAKNVKITSSGACLVT